MPHTESRYQQDLGFNDARIFVGPQDILSFGTTTLTRDAAGQPSYHQGASQTVEYIVDLTSMMIRRTGFGEDTQNFFGASNYNSPASNAIPASAQPQFYRPDIIPAMSAIQQITPRTALKQKGIRIKSFDAIYAISGAALTAHTCVVTQVLYVNNVANAVTTPLASGANGLATATQANTYVTNVNIAPTAGVYNISPDMRYSVEVAVQTAAGGAYILYGLDIVLDINFN